MYIFRIDRTSCETIAQFVKAHDGKRVIQRILIANNGLAAVKEIHSVRRWAYTTFGDDRAIKFIVMSSSEDTDANAEFVRLADEYVAVPGGPNNMNYANVQLIVEVAQRVGAHAVWAGWGHASENPKLPNSLNKIGITFIGPTASAMQALGDKISSMIVAQSANVPCIPWSGSGITIEPDVQGRIEEIPSEIYAQACVNNVDEGLAAAEKVGYPLMIKASEGGGGKGIRSVDDPSDFAMNFDFVQREVPGSPIFLMQLAKEARHLEVQVFADEYGQAVALYGRDCSVQRRHQKIMEEAPVTIVKNPSEWERMEQAAVRLAKMVGYVSAGTVEYLYDAVNDRYSFLELNPRLQVEHPCTESISGVNLPASQLQVAMGIPLHRIADIRRVYGHDELDEGEINFDVECKQPPNGHVIACRVTAENPEVGFKPGGGKVQELTFRSSDDVWAYFSISSFGNVHEFADSQIGHVFAWAVSRKEAIFKMVMALKELTLRAEFRTTVEYLVKLLETKVFQQGTHTTAWLDGLIRSKFGMTIVEGEQVAITASIWGAHREFERRFEEARMSLQRGQAPGSELLERTFKTSFIYQQVQFEVKVTQAGEDRFIVEMCESRLSVKAVRLLDGGLLISALAGQSMLVYGKVEPQGVRLTVNGETVMVENENDPTVVRSPSPGKLVRYLVKEGAVVPAGTAIAELEVMKMYMPLTIPEAGSIMPTKAAGSSLEGGDIVAKIKLLDPTSATKATVNDRGFSSTSPAVQVGKLLNHKFDELMRIFNNCVFGGYGLEVDDQKLLVRQLCHVLFDEHLPFFLAHEMLSKAMNRLPLHIGNTLQEKISRGMSSPSLDLLVECQELLEKQLQSCDARDSSTIKGIIETIKPHRSGANKFVESLTVAVCDRFYCESALFDNVPTVDVIIRRLHDANGNDYHASTRLFAAWASGEERQLLLGIFLKEIIGKLGKDVTSESPLVTGIRKMTKLNDKSFSRINQVSREALMNAQLPSLLELRYEMESQLFSLATLDSSQERDVEVGKLVAGLSCHMDVLPTFFLHSNRALRLLALEIYVRRVFEAFDFVNSSLGDNWFSWVVSAPPALSEQSQTSPSLAEFHRRAGIFAAFDTAEQLKVGFDSVICRLAPETATKNVAYFGIPHEGQEDSQVIREWQVFLQEKVAILAEHDIKRLTLVLVRADSTAMNIYTFRQLLDWKEDCQVRHMEPAMSYLLELPRILHNYSIKLLHADATGQIHIYKGVPRDNAQSPSRLFIRVLVRPRAIAKGHYSLISLTQDARSIFSELLDAVAMVQAHQVKPFDCNHLYINILPTFFSDAKVMADLFLTLMSASEEKLLKVRIMEGEIRMNLAIRKDEAPDRYRFFMWNETGFVNRVAVYKEVRAAEKEASKLVAQGDGIDDLVLDGSKANAPHPLISKLQVKRNRAHALETSYVYDFPAIFKKAVELSWLAAGRAPTKGSFECSELSLRNGQLEEMDRPMGCNEIGMVAWKMKLSTPHYLQGRTIVVIANDIDFEIGSFGVEEDRLFAAASELARRRGWPRIFLSANSGARIGLAEELRGAMKAHWIDASQPQIGFEYLYLEPSDYDRLKGSVCVQFVPERCHYRITDILTGLGVENLSGSALIASETSRAYTEAFTLTFVTGRSVGIGAYLVRLGQRVIQKQTQPIILTGVQALNQLLGREVYASNLQIGGPQIMAANGVSHQVVRTDLEGVQAIVQWLDFVVPQDASLPVTPSLSATCDDNPERPIAYVPLNDTPRDPRLLVTGAETGEGVFLGGLLDRGSFVEYQAAWARSVVVGRGRIGGLPVAVLLVETRTTQTLIPADPASPSSDSRQSRRLDKFGIQIQPTRRLNSFAIVTTVNVCRYSF